MIVFNKEEGLWSEAYFIESHDKTILFCNIIINKSLLLICIVILLPLACYKHDLLTKNCVNLRSLTLKITHNFHELSILGTKATPCVKSNTTSL